MICGRITDRLAKTFHYIEPVLVKPQHGQTSKYLEASKYQHRPRAASQQLELFLDSDGLELNSNPVCSIRRSSIPLV